MKIRWLLIAWMFVISGIAYLDRVNISIAGQFLQKELQLSDTQLGWVFSAFVFGYALSQAPGGRLADRFGPRRTITFATLWWGVFTALTAAVSSHMAGALAILITASLTPYLANHFGWTASFMVAAALCLIGALSWLMVNPEAQIVAAPDNKEIPALSDF